MYHNCSSPRGLSIRNLNVIARLNPNSSRREAYYFGGVVSPAFKSHTSIAAMIYLVFNILNVPACVSINSPSVASEDKILANCRAVVEPYMLALPKIPPHSCQKEFPKAKLSCLWDILLKDHGTASHHSGEVMANLQNFQLTLRLSPKHFDHSGSS